MAQLQPHDTYPLDQSGAVGFIELGQIHFKQVQEVPQSLLLMVLVRCGQGALELFLVSFRPATFGFLTLAFGKRFSLLLQALLAYLRLSLQKDHDGSGHLRQLLLQQIACTCA